MTIESGDAIRQLCENFINGNAPRFIFGRTPYAMDIARHILPDGFIDDFTNNKVFMGVPVVRLCDVPKNAIVVSSIVDGRPVTADRILKESGLASIDYFTFKNNTGLHLKEPTHVNSTAFNKDYALHHEKYSRLYECLADDISKETFSRLVNFRLHEDLAHLAWFSFRPKDIYFESFLELEQDALVFVDVGCFDGETTLDFIRHYPGYNSIHLFEPEPKQMALIKSKLNSIRAVNFHEYGASNQEGSLRFTSSGIWSHLDKDGDIEVKINTIDNLIKEKVSFIKMDIEGHEYAALEGARQHILNDHPVLAICAYHQVDDFWKLPELVFSYRSDYKLYMRHYTEGMLETVYYFIPHKHV